MQFTVRTSLIAWGVFVATPAAAQHDFNLLVAPQGADCFGDCVGPFATFAEAAEAAALLPDVDGARPDVRIGLDEGQDLIETVVIDNSDGQLGAPLRLDFAWRTICPDPAAPPGEPAVLVRPGPLEEDIVARLVLDLRTGGPCGSTARPGVRFEGDGRGAVEGGLIAGTLDYAVQHTGEGLGLPGSGGLSVREVRIANCDGAAIDSRPFAWLQRVEVVGCVLDEGSEHRGLVAGGAGTGGMGIVHSAFVGNLITGGADGARGLIVGPLARLENTVFAGNALLDGQPVLRTGYLLRTWEFDDESLLLDSGPRPFHDVVFADNVHRTAPPAPADVSALGVRPMPTQPHCVGDELLAHPAAGLWLGTGKEGDGPIIAIDREVGDPWDGDLTFARSWFIGNRTGDRALIEVRDGTSGTWIHLLQNTFADNGGAPLLAAGAELPDGGLTVARNLHIDADATAEGPLVDASGVPGTVVITDNLSGSQRPWLDEGEEPEALLVGPNSSGGDVAFLDQSWAVGLTDCARAAAISPDVDLESCEEPNSAPMSLSCAPGAAAAWVAADPASPWPWQTGFFGDPESTPRGATGWSYSSVRAPIDRIPQDPGWGDGEGFPDLVDCDNFDAAVFPVVPEHDGIHSGYCVEPEGSCYRCPNGVLPPPADDDDSAGDDDDSGEVGEQPPAGVFTEDSGCGQGCGFSWGDGGVEVVRAGVPLIALLGFRRRRRT